MRRQLPLILVVGLAAGLLASQTPPPAFRLDAASGVGGIRFDEPADPAAGLRPAPGGIGKRWRTTKLYQRPGDTTHFGGLPLPATYWFRQNRFAGVDVPLTEAMLPQVLAYLTAHYGPARPDTLPNQWYWLGQHSYILLEHTTKKNGMLFMASLAMLNEQVYETAVRARARRVLHWQPDSLGLPRQFPSR
ncbi:MAG: hypothetical protein ACRYF0_12695 [Janthinobacterium lividum]